MSQPVVTLPSNPKPYLAFFAYLLGPVGWGYVLLFQKADGFARYHARQSRVLTVIAVGTLLAWGIVGWVVSWVPFGFIFVVASFAFVLAVYVFLGIAWIVGMFDAVNAKMKPLPIVSKLEWPMSRGT